MTDSSPADIPSAARWLGVAGLIPFIALTAAILGVGGLENGRALPALIAYGAVILTFLGGVQWGLSIAKPAGVDATWPRLTVSILPSLAAWAVLFMPPDVGLLALTAAFAAVLAFDIAWSRRGWSPSWYPRLRIALSLVVIGCLIVARLAI